MQVPERRILLIGSQSMPHAISRLGTGPGLLLTEAPLPGSLAGVRSGAPDNAEWLAQTVEARSARNRNRGPAPPSVDDVEPGYALNEFLG